MRVKIRGKIFIPMAFSLLALIGVIFIVLSVQLNKLSLAFITDIGHSKMEVIYSSMDLVYGEAESVSSLFGQLPEVQEAYEVALSGNIDDPESPQSQRAREMLRSSLQDLLDSYENMKGEPLMLHFHLPNGRSLVRLWRGQNARRDGQWVDISDDISGFRETVVHVNETGEPAEGLEVGRGGFSLRKVLPVVSSKGRHLGSVEMLIDFNPIIETAAAGKEHDLLLYMNQDLLSIAVELQDQNKYPIIDDSFVKVTGTDNPETNRLITKDLLNQGRTDLNVKNAGNLSLAVFPVKDFTDKQVGVMVYARDISKEKALIRNLTIALLVIMAVLLVLLMIAGLVSIKYAVMRPLGKILTFAGLVAEGDLSRQLEIKSKDEMEELGSSLQTMVNNLKEKINEAEQQTEMARQETEKAEQFRLQAEEAMKNAEQAQKEGMLNAALKIEHVIESLSSASEELSAQVEQASRGSEEQQQRTQETATSMEEMNATVLEVAKNASLAAEHSEEAQNYALKGSQTVQEAIEAIRKVQTAAEELKSKIAGLGQRAEGIGRIMVVIEDIADQTNLLALNAAIEAARAGEAGRGFAVVADEVRKLAEKTMNATKEVGESIQAIQDDVQSNARSVDSTVEHVQKATDLSNRSGKQLEEIVALAEKASDQVRAIATASEEQSSASEEINRSVDDINRTASETADVMSQSAKAISDLAQQASELQALVQQMKDQA